MNYRVSLTENGNEHVEWDFPEPTCGDFVECHGDGPCPLHSEPTENEHGFVCAEFDEDGSCIHSDHMMKAGI